MAETIIGIDLGTTNSEVAIVENGVPRVLAEDGDPILPSVVGLGEDGRLLVGRAARNQWALAPERTIKSIKRQMGQDVKIPLGPDAFTPQEISAMILKALKARAEKELGRPVSRAVITVPAYFNDAQRQATREAGALAGLDVVRILNEPTAAALTYNPHAATGTPAPAERILVYDLGGGTFDVSIVQTERGVVEVLASHGDTHLGGDDFDELLLNHVADQFHQLYDVDLRASRVSRARVLHAVEEAKKRLSDHAVTVIEEEFIAEKDGIPLHLSLEVERVTFERLIRPLIDRTLLCVQKALDDARLTATQIDRVVLVGGSTRVPLIGQLLEDRLGQPAHREIHPDLCVAMGAAIQAAIIAGQTVGSVLVDITPHSLGIRCLDYEQDFGFRPTTHRFAPIIKRNTPLPTSRSEIFCTVVDHQPCVEIDIYQGEDEDVRRNHRVGRFLIEGLAPVPAGNPIIVQLDLTLDGILKVFAKEKATGLKKQVTIENVLSRFTLAERDSAQARIERLWRAFQTGEIPEPGAEASSDDAPLPRRPQPTASSDSPSTDAASAARDTALAQAILEKAQRLRAKATPEDQNELDRLMTRLSNALARADWPELHAASHELSDVLFYLEDA